MILHALLVSALGLCFSAFAWAIRCHFRGGQPVGLGMRAIGILGLLFVLLHAAALVMVPVGGWSAAVALGLYALSQGVFWWAIAASRAQRLSLAYSGQHSAFLLERGPYARIRHPFYLSYTLFWIAAPVATGLWFLLVTAVVMAALYAQAARAEEKALLAGPLGDAYRNYRARTAAVIPGVL